MKYSKYKALAHGRRRAERFSGLVISLHGMKARGEWQKHLGSVCQDYSLKHEAYDYGWRVFEPFIPWKRSSRVDHFLEWYEGTVRGVKCPVSVVGHSYGSWIVGRLLENRPAIRLNRVIFFGSILNCDYDWAEKVRRQQVKGVLNEASSADWWSWLAPYVIWGAAAGHAGCHGFNACPEVTNVLRSKVGHSDLQYRTHYREIWIPYIKRGDVPLG